MSAPQGRIGTVAPWEGPAAPRRSLRGRPWTRSELVAVRLRAEPDQGSRGSVSFGLVPIREGRIELGGFRQERCLSSLEAREQLGKAFDGRYLAVWSVEREAACLDGTLGWDSAGWRKRTVDVGSLVAAVEGRAPNGEEPCEPAARYHVPGVAAEDPAEEALLVAQLFLVAATKLAFRGETTMGQLLRYTRLSPDRRLG